MKPRGPRPTPTAILAARGSKRARARKDEPIPPGALPEPPDWLSPAAAAEWQRLVPELLSIRLMTAADWSTFAGYCQAFAHWQAAEEFMGRHGTVIVVRDDKGTVKFSQAVPQFAIAQKSQEKMLRFAAELGLTPAARARLRNRR